MPGLQDRFYWGTLAILAIVYAILAAMLPPLDDELYYWCWSKKPQLSYFDHAPLSAYMIAASTAVFGDSVFALRLPALLSSLVVVGVLGAWMRPRWLWPYVISTPLFTFGAVLITPDTPLLLFWTLYLAWLIDVHKRLKPAEGCDPGTISLGRWALGGALLGLGALGKYTMALAVPAAFLTFVVALPRDPLRWLPGYLFHGFVSFLVFLPVLIFNIEQEFVPIRFQWDHANVENGGGVKGLLEFAAIQVVLFGVLPIAMLPWTWWNIRRLIADPKLRVCSLFFAVPMTFFLYKACRGPLEGNWALAAYLGFWPVAADWHGRISTERKRRIVRIVGLGVPTGLVILMAIHMLHPLPLLKPRQDRITRLGARLEAAKCGASEAKRLAPGLPIYTPTYQWAAMMNFAGAECFQMREISRPSHFTLPGTVPVSGVEEILVWNEAPVPTHLLPDYELIEMLGHYPIVVRGEWVSCLTLFRYKLATHDGGSCPVLGLSSYGYAAAP